MGNRDQEKREQRKPLRCQWIEDALTRKPKRCRSHNGAVHEFGQRRDGTRIYMVLCPLHFVAASKGLTSDGT